MQPDTQRQNNHCKNQKENKAVLMIDIKIFVRGYTQNIHKITDIIKKDSLTYTDNGSQNGYCQKIPFKIFNKEPYPNDSLKRVNKDTSEPEKA